MRQFGLHGWTRGRHFGFFVIQLLSHTLDAAGIKPIPLGKHIVNTVDSAFGQLPAQRVLRGHHGLLHRLLGNFFLRTDGVIGLASHNALPNAPGARGQVIHDLADNGQIVSVGCVLKLVSQHALAGFSVHFAHRRVQFPHFGASNPPLFAVKIVQPVADYPRGIGSKRNPAGRVERLRGCEKPDPGLLNLVLEVESRDVEPAGQRGRQPKVVSYKGFDSPVFGLSARTRALRRTSNCSWVSFTPLGSKSKESFGFFCE